jgi:hypothetical protein
MSQYGHNRKTKKQKSWDVKEPKLLDDTEVKGRVDLRVDDFDRMIEQKGVNIKVYRTSYCPNVKSVDGGEHEIDCTLCNGSGFIDRNPLCAKAFFQNQDLERMLDSQSGQHDGNSVLVTLPIGIEIQYFTLIELVDFTDLYFQRVLRKPGTVIDILKYKACRVNMVIDKNGVEYFQDQDFKLDANGSVKWLGTRKPGDNVIYSIHYEKHSQFRAIRAMHVNRFTQYKAPGEPKVEHIKMMEQWLCTKEFLLRRRDINTNLDLHEGPYDNHSNTTDDNG